VHELRSKPRGEVRCKRELVVRAARESVSCAEPATRRGTYRQLLIFDQQSIELLHIITTDSSTYIP
jgi:hypothetical protein